MSGISTLGQALDQISRLKTQQSLMEQLSSQVATGKKTQSFTGLGLDVIKSKQARADIKSLDVYMNNIKIADRRIKLMMNGLEDIKEQAQTVLDSLVVSIQEGDYPNFE